MGKAWRRQDWANKRRNARGVDSSRRGRGSVPAQPAGMGPNPGALLQPAAHPPTWKAGSSGRFCMMGAAQAAGACVTSKLACASQHGWLSAMEAIHQTVAFAVLEVARDALTCTLMPLPSASGAVSVSGPSHAVAAATQGGRT